MIGFIYIMSNPAYPGSLKIGQTSKDPEERRRDLGSTGVLEDFILEYRALSEDYKSLEREIHRNLANSRIRDDREFFTISVPEAIHIIREIAGDRIESERVFYTSPEKLKKIEEEMRVIEEERRAKLEKWIKKAKEERSKIAEEKRVKQEKELKEAQRRKNLIVKRDKQKLARAKHKQKEQEEKEEKDSEFGKKIVLWWFIFLIGFLLFAQMF